MITKPIRIEKESLDALEIIARKEEEKTGYKINETNAIMNILRRGHNGKIHHTYNLDTYIAIFQRYGRRGGCAVCRIDQKHRRRILHRHDSQLTRAGIIMPTGGASQPGMERN